MAGKLFGFPISTLDLPALIARLIAPAGVGGGMQLVVTMNLDHVVKLRRDSRFRQAYARAAIVTLDGAPVSAFAKLKGLDAPRCPGSDLTAALAPRLDPLRHRPFFVLSSLETVAAVRQKLLNQGFQPDQLGFQSPDPGFERDAAASHALAAAIKAHAPTHIFFGLGAPKSEIWLAERQDQFGDVHALAIGASLEFWAGTAKRAPKLMRRIGLEWAWRVAHDPVRLFRRYFISSWAFLPAMLEDLASGPDSR